MTDPNKLKAPSERRMEKAISDALTVLHQMARTPADVQAVEDWRERNGVSVMGVLRSGSLIPAQPTPEQGRVEELEKEVERLAAFLQAINGSASKCVTEDTYTASEALYDLQAIRRTCLAALAPPLPDPAALNKGEG